MITWSRHCGISLVELLTTVGIAAVTLTLGVPAFTGVQTSMQRTQASMELISSFSLARSEAARQGTSVTICPSTDGATCAAALECSADRSQDWGCGWIVFIDRDRDAVVDNGTDQIIHIARFARGTFRLTADNANIANSVLFPPSGFLAETGRYTYCDKSESREMDLSHVGRIELGATGTGCQ
jgi:type IV fimbrial biogenesis protein FimT